jgi:hypothetical protein
MTRYPSWRPTPSQTQSRCRDSILYRLVLAYFMAHDHWASQRNITIMYPGHFPTLARCIPTLALSLHSCASARSIAHIFAFHCASSHFTVHLRVSLRIFTFHRASSRSITHLCVLVHLHVSPCIFAFSCIFAFHHASSRSIAHLRVSSRFSAHHRRSIHPLSSQFLGASHSVYYYI